MGGGHCHTTFRNAARVKPQRENKREKSLSASLTGLFYEDSSRRLHYVLLAINSLTKEKTRVGLQYVACHGTGPLIWNSY